MTSTHQISQENPAPSSDRENIARASIADLFIVTSVMAAAVLGMITYQSARAGGAFSALLSSDEKSYYLPGAEAILSEGLGWFLTPRSLWNGPVNPLWIAAFGANPLTVKIANLGLFALSGLAVWDIGRRLFGKRAAYWSLFLFVTYLPFYEFVPSLLTEPLFVPLVILAIWLALIGDADRSWFDLGAGLAFGLATLVRPTLQLYPVALIGVAGLVSIGAKRHGQLPDRVLKRSLTVCIGFVIVVVPYLVKNIVVLDRVAISNGSGAVLYLGNDLRKRGYEPVDSSMQFDTLEITFPYTHLDTEGDRLLTEEALRRIRLDPFDVVAMQPSKMVKLVFGTPEHYFRPQDNVIDFVSSRSGYDLLKIWHVASNAIVVSLGALGLLVLRPPLFARLVMVSIVVYFALTNTLLFPIPRLFLPAIPILMMFAGGLLTQGRRGPRVAGLVTAACVTVVIAFCGVFDGVPTVSDRYVGYFHEVVAETGGEWAGTRDVSTGPEGELLTTGDDPYLVFDVPDFEARVNQIVFVTVSLLAAESEVGKSHGQLFWRSLDEQFAEERSEGFELVLDGDTHTYAVSPSFRRQWEGEIDEIRLDLPDNSGLQVRMEDLEVRR